MEMAKEAYQDGHDKMRMITKGKRDMLHKLAPFVTLLPLVHSLNCKTKPFSKYSSKIEPDQISPTINRKKIYIEAL